VQESALVEVGGMSWGEFKPALADAVIAHLAPLQQRYADVMADPGFLEQVVAAAVPGGCVVANVRASVCRCVRHALSCPHRATLHLAAGTACLCQRRGWVFAESECLLCHRRRTLLTRTDVMRFSLSVLVYWSGR
jgi:hypothetical protein